MKKIYLIIFCFCIHYGFSQNIKATLLVELIHEDVIQQITKDHTNTNTINSKNDVSDLINSLSDLYTEKYTDTELKTLYTFYASPVGKKSILDQAELHAKVLDRIYKWDAKQRGIELIEEEALVTDEVLTLEDEVLSKDDTPSYIPPAKKELPKVHTIEDLKALIKENTNILFDTQLLAKLLNMESLIDPARTIEEVSVGKIVEKKK